MNEWIGSGFKWFFQKIMAKKKNSKKKHESRFTLIEYVPIRRFAASELNVFVCVLFLRQYNECRQIIA